MATNLLASLDDLCKEVLDGETPPKIIVQLYTDVNETVEDLQRVRLHVIHDTKLIGRLEGSLTRLLSRSFCLASNLRAILSR